MFTNVIIKLKRPSFLVLVFSCLLFSFAKSSSIVDRRTIIKSSALELNGSDMKSSSLSNVSSNGNEMDALNVSEQEINTLDISQPLSIQGEFPPIHNDWIYWVWEYRAGYNIRVPSTTTPGWWREFFLFPGLDSYDSRIDRYRQAFVIALMQPELAARLKESGYLYDEVSHFAALTSDVVGLPAEIYDIVDAIRYGGTIQLQPTYIQTTLYNWKQVVRSVHLKQSLDKLGLALGGVSFAAKIGSDALNDIFLHTIANAMVIERMDAFDRVFQILSPSDPAIYQGYLLAKSDVSEFLDEDYNALKVAINTFSDHGSEYIIRTAVLAPAIAAQLNWISSTLAHTIGRVVLPYYLAYNIGSHIFAEMEDMQVMCADATLAYWILDDVLSNYPLPDPTDPNYSIFRRTRLNVMQVRYGLAYSAKHKYDEILDINWLNPAEWIQWAIQNITGTWGSVAEFRSSVLQTSMDNNFNWAIEISDYLRFGIEEPPQVISYQVGSHISTNIYVTFSEDMQQLTMNDATISISGSASGVHYCNYLFNHSNFILTINPLNDFNYDELVVVSISTDVQDLNGVHLTEPYILNFWTETEDIDPTNILITSLSLFPPTVDPYGTFEVNGHAEYNNGNDITAGTAIITIEGGNTYTAAVINGQFSRYCQAPGNSSTSNITRQVNVAVSDGSTSSGQSSASLTIRGQGGVSYTLTTDIVYDWEGDNYSVTWWSKDAFRTTDYAVELIAVFENLNIDHDLDLMWRCFYPNDTQYGSDLVKYNAISSGWDWGWSVWGWLISGYSMAYNPGKYRMEFFVDDNRKATHYYVVAWDFTQHFLCKDYDGEWQPIGQTNIFRPSDTRAVALHHFEYRAQALDVKTAFYSPEGFYNSSSYSFADDLGPHEWWGWSRHARWIRINGYSPQYMCGDWKVKFYVKNPSSESWEHKYTDYFKILEDTPPSVAVSHQPQNPIETQSVTVSVSATDNNHLERIVLHWNDGTEYSREIATRINDGSYSDNEVIGAFSSNQSVTYWMEVWDESGNRTQSEYETFIVQSESVTEPSRPVGPTFLVADESGQFSTGGSTTNLGNAVEYRFDWADGSLSAWGGAAASKSWSDDGTYIVKSQARSQVNTNILSSWSPGLPVIVDTHSPNVVITTNDGADTTVFDPSMVISGYSEDKEPTSGIASTEISTGTINNGDASDWSFDVTLDEGENQLIVTSEDNSGNTGYDTIIVNYVISTKPLLSWTDEVGYEADGVDPDSGYHNTTFEFRIKYSDAGGDEPALNYPLLYLKADGTPVPGSPFEMTETCSDPVELGRIYMAIPDAAYIGFNPDLSYTYKFEAVDAVGDTAVGEGSIEVPGPVILRMPMTIWVDSCNTFGPWDGTEEHPYNTIQAGIDATFNSDTVFVLSGSYLENVICNKSVVIRGYDASTTILDGGNAEDCLKLIDCYPILVEKLQIINPGRYPSSGINCNSGCAEVELRENIIRGTLSTSHFGTGITIWSADPSIQIHNNLFLNNSNAIVTKTSSTPNIYNNTFYNNNAAIYDATAGNPRIERNIVVGSYLAVYAYSSTPYVACNDLWNNTYDYATYGAGEYVPFQPIPGAGEQSVDPLFCDPELIDFYIQDISPCAPVNSPCGELVGAFDVNCTATSTLLSYVNVEPSIEGITVMWQIEGNIDANFFNTFRSNWPSDKFEEAGWIDVNGSNGFFQFIDTRCEFGAAYQYQVFITNEEEKGVLFVTEVVRSLTPKLPTLSNYPNPFNPVTRLRLFLPHNGMVFLGIVDTAGRTVEVLIPGTVMEAGMHDISWDGCDNSGHPVSSGVYFAVLRTGKQKASCKLVVMH